MELIYYFKNINSLTLDGTNFSLNDLEFLKVKEISQTINHNVLILFWQFAIKTCEELDIVSNQNLAIEMFLIRLIYISSIKNRDEDISSESIKSLETEDNVKELKLKPLVKLEILLKKKK